jgi:hypothetical protein
LPELLEFEASDVTVCPKALLFANAERPERVAALKLDDFEAEVLCDDVLASLAEVEELEVSLNLPINNILIDIALLFY